MKMTPNRGYVCRAVYEWILDNEATPYLYVNALAKDVEVPQEYVSKGQIVLNISPSAVQDLVLQNDGIGFNARFGGIPRTIWVPIWAVLGLVAQETNQGMFFDPQEIEPFTPSEEPITGVDSDEPDPDSPPPSSTPKGRPTLKVVK
jgi:stringent starvation protein B